MFLKFRISQYPKIFIMKFFFNATLLHSDFHPVLGPRWLRLLNLVFLFLRCQMFAMIRIYDEMLWKAMRNERFTSENDSKNITN